MRPPSLSLRWFPGRNLDDAIRSLIKQTHSHIHSVFVRKGFEQLIDDVDIHAMDGYWKYYRRIDFTLARVGKNLSHKAERLLFYPAIHYQYFIIPAFL